MLLAGNVKDSSTSTYLMSLHLFDSSGGNKWDYLINLGSSAQYYTPKQIAYVSNSAIIVSSNPSSNPIWVTIISFTGTSNPTAH